MSIVEVEQYSNGDDGEYVVLSGNIGRVEYEVTVEDGIRGRRVSVAAIDFDAENVAERKTHTLVL